MNPEDYKFIYWVKLLPSRGKPSSLYMLQQQDKKFQLFTTDRAGFFSELLSESIDGVDFDIESGELKITHGANYVSTNLDGRYRLSKQIEDIVNAEPTVLDAWNIEQSSGAYIDYMLQSGSNQRVGRIIATWNELGAMYTDYSSPEIGNIGADIYVVEHAGFAEFTINSNVNGLRVKALITTI